MSAALSPGATTLAASGPPAQNGVLEIVVLAVLLVLLAYGMWRRRALRRRYHLDRRQRAVSLSQQWLEPALALVLVAGVLAKDVAAGSTHVVALIAGGFLGAALGVVRGRYMLGSARRVGERLVLERNWQELAIVFLLVGLQMLQREVSAHSTSAVALISTALLSAGVLESVGRVGYITIRARSAQRDGPETPGPVRGGRARSGPLTDDARGRGTDDAPAPAANDPGDPRDPRRA